MPAFVYSAVGQEAELLDQQWYLPQQFLCQPLSTVRWYEQRNYWTNRGLYSRIFNAHLCVQ